MRSVSVLLATLGIAAICAPAQAQERITRLDYGFSYVIPNGYRIDPDFSVDGLFGDTLIDLQTKDGILSRGVAGSSGYTNISILSSITLTSLPVERIIITPDDDKPKSNTSPEEEKKRVTSRAKRLVEGLDRAFRKAGITMDYQNSAPIKVSGEDAIAVRCNSFVEGSDTEYTVRLIFLIRQDKLFTFLFAAKNADFEEEVKPFDAFMRSFKFLKIPGTQPTPKPAPKPPLKKKPKK
jgi:hypothetical protein